MRIFIRLLMIITLGLGIAACAETKTQESTGQYMDNSVVTMKVKSALLKDDEVKSMPITVKTYKGEVQLSGFVNSSKAAHRAVKITQGVSGVHSVRNNLVVK